MPVVGQPGAGGLRLIAPGVGRAVEPAARGELPLGLGRQRAARPSSRRPPRPRRRRARPDAPRARRSTTPGPRVAPARARRPGPPLVEVARSTGPARAREHQRARHQVLRRRAGKVRRVERALGDGRRSRSRPRTRRSAVGDLGAVDPEPVDRDRAGRRLLRVVASEPIAERRRGIQISSVWPSSRRRVFQSSRMLTTVQPGAVSTIGSAPGRPPRPRSRIRARRRRVDDEAKRRVVAGVRELEHLDVAVRCCRRPGSGGGRCGSGCGSPSAALVERVRASRLVRTSTTRPSRRSNVARTAEPMTSSGGTP